jgi:hypothetical protein
MLSNKFISDGDLMKNIVSCLLKIAILVSIMPTALIAQTPTSVPTQPTAKEILQMAVKAAGGETWQQPKTLLLKGDAVWTPHGKTDAASMLRFDDYAMYRVFPTENDNARQANGKVRFDAKYDARASGEPFMQLIFDGKVTHSFLSDAAKPYQKHFSWSNNFGFGILRFADREGFSVARLVDDQVEGVICYVVQITDPKKMVTTFFIDRETKFIRSVAFNTDVGYHHRIYSDFKRAANVDFVQPTRVRLYFDGIKWMDINWRQFAVNEAILDSVFVVEADKEKAKTKAF